MEFIEDFLKGLDMGALVDFFTSYYAWLILAVVLVVVLGLFAGIFRGKYRWVWRGAMVLATTLVVMFFCNFAAFFVNAYMDNTVGTASRSEIGRYNPALARKIEMLLTGPIDGSPWDESVGFLSADRTFTNQDGKCVIKRHLLHTSAEVVTDEAEWHAISFMGKVWANVTYTSSDQ
ncbi:MAG: hypothetical protein HFE85_02730 [Clostridiales bacterium]|nr:hypothetical protein [Clostridiales bacterium]